MAYYVVPEADSEGVKGVHHWVIDLSKDVAQVHRHDGTSLPSNYSIGQWVSCLIKDVPTTPGGTPVLITVDLPECPFA